MRDGASEIEAAGGTIAAVGCGEPRQAGALREKLELPFPVLADPDRRSFRAAGMRRDPIGVMSPVALAHAWRAWRRGARQEGVQGDPWQLGGTLVVAPGGKLLFEHRSREAGDHAPLAALVEALRSKAN